MTIFSRQIRTHGAYCTQVEIIYNGASCRKQSKYYTNGESCREQSKYLQPRYESSIPTLRKIKSLHSCELGVWHNQSDRSQPAAGEKGNMGVDIKHNSYQRRLAKLKGKLLATCV